MLDIFRAVPALALTALCGCGATFLRAAGGG